MSDDPPIDVDAIIVAADDPSRRGWRQRALRRSQTDAALATPAQRTIHVQFPLTGYRLYKAWCDEQGITVHDHLRASITLTLQAAGWTPEETAHLHPQKRTRG